MMGWVIKEGNRLHPMEVNRPERGSARDAIKVLSGVRRFILLAAAFRLTGSVCLEALGEHL